MFVFVAFGLCVCGVSGNFMVLLCVWESTPNRGFGFVVCFYEGLLSMGDSGWCVFA